MNREEEYSRDKHQDTNEKETNTKKQVTKIKKNERNKEPRFTAISIFFHDFTLTNACFCYTVERPTIAEV